ncbi:integral membrane protein [Vibrio sp. JCM 19236]|nr:integral membrane protein [Vibrio sp. JCM 19236]
MLVTPLFALSWKAGDLFISNVGYDDNDLSSLIAVLNIVKVAVNFLIGVFTAKFIAEKTFLNNSQLFMLGCLSVGASMFALPMGESFYYIAVCRAVLGFGGALILFTMNPLVASIFPENELPVVNGLNSSAFNVGIALMLTLAGVMASEPSLVTNIVAILAVAVALLFFIANRSSVTSMKSRLQIARSTTQELDNNQEQFGITDGLKSGFNWLFALTFTGIMSFYYVAFTFLDGATVKYLMYAGIVGNFAGIAGAKALPHIVVARLASFVSVVLAVSFMFTLGSELSPWIAGALGFVMMFSLPSYVTLGFRSQTRHLKR